MNYPRPPQQPYPGHYPPPYPPQRKNNTVLWVVLGITGSVILLCGGCLGLVGIAATDSKTKATTTTVAAAAPNGARETSDPRSQEAPVGTPVRDGKFEFVVTGLEQGATTVGDGFWREAALGEFVIVRVTVTNVGDEARRFSGSNQKLIDEQGREFESSFAANAALNDRIYGQELNPGLGIAAVLVFDVPPGTNPAAAVFHDSLLSGGARVALR